MSVQYRSATAAGVKVAHREAGDPASPALLLLHGFPASSSMYRNLMRALADRFHLVATEEPLHTFLEPDGVKWIYTEGARDPERISPDNWNLDLAVLARPIAGLIRAVYTTRVTRPVNTAA